MKRAFFFAAIVFLGLIYYSAGSPMEVADRVMVHAIGIDPVEDGYRVTLQVFSPASGGSETAIDPSQPNVSLVKGEGGSAAEAIHDCESRLGGTFSSGRTALSFSAEIPTFRVTRSFSATFSARRRRISTPNAPPLRAPPRSCSRFRYPQT